MARHRPSSLAEMADVHGISEAKLARYGADVLAIIRKHREGE